MKLDLMTRKRITKEVSKRYKKTYKKEKGRILDEFCALSGYNRSYAGWVLRKGASPKKKGKSAPRGLTGADRRGRKPVYTVEVRRALVKVWAILDCPCGKRLVAAIPETVKALERFGEIKLKEDIRGKLLAMSASTADRLLASERKKFELKSRSKTKPGSLLKHQIEPPRLSWRLHSLRGWSHEYTKEISTGAEGTGGAHGLRPRTRVRVTVGGDPLDLGEVRHDGGDAAHLGETGRT